ncbi:MAG: fumarylacetoacetate hydrolase family protein [Pseudonocardiaceae bacterium]|nr:fumarylacetoacetate hydrolase family protein [Pseudonocardiaceae bacterium]
MRWSTFRTTGDEDHVGVWRDDTLYAVPGVRRLVDLLGDDGTRLREAAETAIATREAVDLATVELLAPIPDPPSIRDFMAFEEHVVTASDAIGLTVDPLWYEQPVFYFTNPAAVLGPHADVPIPPGSGAFDYELEVAAVVGKDGSDLTPEEAERHIAGFMLYCDWSARDLQGTEMKLNLGPAKGKDSANGFGPWLVTADELASRGSGRGYDVALTASVNGAGYSGGNVADLYWSFGEMIAYASRGTRVRPGDVIGSGTVGTGCVLELSRVHGAEKYPWLHAGDRVRLEAELLGAIDARVVAGSSVRPLRPPEGARG